MWMECLFLIWQIKTRFPHKIVETEMKTGSGGTTQKDSTLSTSVCFWCVQIGKNYQTIHEGQQDAETFQIKPIH